VPRNIERVVHNLRILRKFLFAREPLVLVHPGIFDHLALVCRNVVIGVVFAKAAFSVISQYAPALTFQS
jgi:hypothetical protein